MLIRRFPFVLYYLVEAATIDIYAILDCRRDHSWIRKTWLSAVTLARRCRPTRESLQRTGRRRAHQLFLPGNTTAGRSVDASSTCSMTSKGQVTIPKALRQQLGLARGSRVSFQLVGDHIEVRPCKPQQPVSSSGFGLLTSQRPPVPAEFDPASLLRP